MSAEKAGEIWDEMFATGHYLNVKGGCWGLDLFAQVDETKTGRPCLSVWRKHGDKPAQRYFSKAAFSADLGRIIKAGICTVQVGP